jgi:DNA-binding transcriptional LysR family regulator
MELRQLRAFAVVASKGHFGQAAASLNLTQPALTLRIQALEKELGAPLLDRNSREVRLTAAGKVLLPYAQNLIETEDRALADMRQHAAAKAGHLRISYLTLWDGLPTSIVSEFGFRYPAVTVDTTGGYSEPNLERVLRREVDMAFLSMAFADCDEVTLRPLERHRLVLIMPPTHRLAGFDTIPIRELRGEPIIGLSAGMNTVLVASATNWLAHHLGEAPNFVAFEPPDQMARAVANRGNAVALMSVPKAAASVHLGIVYRQISPSPVLDYGMAYRNDNHSEALAGFLQVVDELAPSISGELPEGCEALSLVPPLGPVHKPEIRTAQVRG